MNLLGQLVGAVLRSEGGMVRSSAMAVLRLVTSSFFGGLLHRWVGWLRCAHA